MILQINTFFYNTCGEKGLGWLGVKFYWKHCTVFAFMRVLIVPYRWLCMQSTLTKVTGTSSWSGHCVLLTKTKLTFEVTMVLDKDHRMCHHGKFCPVQRYSTYTTAPSPIKNERLLKHCMHYYFLFFPADILCFPKKNGDTSPEDAVWSLVGTGRHPEESGQTHSPPAQSSPERNEHCCKLFLLCVHSCVIK